jgi:ribosomal protein L37E
MIVADFGRVAAVAPQFHQQGADVDTPRAEPPRVFGESGNIVADVACRRCGYNLRTLRADGRCPECGTPVGLSTHGDLLRYAEPAWVEKLGLGIRYMLWGIVVAIALSVLGGCVQSAWGLPQAAADAVGLVGSLLGLYGAWLLTTPDPSGIGEDGYVTARKVVRFGLIVGLLNQCIMIAIHAVPGLSALVIVFLVIPAVLAGLVSVVAEFAKYLYLQKLAERIPDPSLAGFARFLRWAYSIGLAAALVFGGLIMIGFVTAPGPFPGWATPAATASAPGAPAVPGAGALPPVPFGGMSPILGMLLLTGACIFSIAMLVFSILTIVLLVRCGRRFREQAEVARSTWGAALSPPSPTPPPVPGREQ